MNARSDTSPRFGREVEPPPTAEEIASVAADIRARHSTRSEMSRAACWWLFMRGIKPSTASVRQLTELGSTGDIQRDIAEFWTELRERMASPLIDVDLPADVRSAITSAMADVMRVMRDQARSEFDAERERATAQVVAATQDAERMRLQLEDVRTRGVDLERQLAEMAEVRSTESTARARAETALAAAKADIERLRGDLDKSQLRHASLERDLLEERRGRAADREAGEQRVAAERARADADFRSVQVALDAARQEVKRVERELAAIVARLDEERAARAADADRAGAEATGLRARIGELEVQLSAAVAARQAGEELLRLLGSRVEALGRSERRSHRKGSTR